MNALIADDDAITRLLLNSALTKLGHTVHEAANGREAWEAWAAGMFPLIVSDWMMPGLDGLDFCRRIRHAGRAEYTYILLLSSRTGKMNYLDAMEAGADDFITKPLEKDAFAARVRAAERILGLHANLLTANTELDRRVRKRTAELETALHARDAFYSAASHELRTPMHQILGFAQLLNMDPLDADQKESVRQILASGASLMALIDRILQVAGSDGPAPGLPATSKGMLSSPASASLSASAAEDPRRR